MLRLDDWIPHLMMNIVVVHLHLWGLGLASKLLSWGNLLVVKELFVSLHMILCIDKV